MQARSDRSAAMQAPSSAHSDEGDSEEQSVSPPRASLMRSVRAPQPTAQAKHSKEAQHEPHLAFSREEAERWLDGELP